MLSVTETVEKLYKMPERFEQLMSEKKYYAAKWLHFECLITAIFIEADESFMEKMFGENGLFDRELLKTAYREAGGGIDNGSGSNEEIENTGRNIRPFIPEKGLLGRVHATQAGDVHSSVS